MDRPNDASRLRQLKFDDKTGEAAASDAAGAVLRLLSAMPESDRLLRDLLLELQAGLSIMTAAIISGESILSLYAEMEDSARAGERARRAAAQYLTQPPQRASIFVIDEKEDEPSGTETCAYVAGSRYEYCALLSASTPDQPTVLYLRTPAPLTPSEGEILDALVGCARLAVEHTNLSTSRNRPRPFVSLRLPDGTGRTTPLIANSWAMMNMIRQLDLVKNSDLPVLITGESGSGKELIARALHMEGLRSSKPFIPFNCTAVAEDIAESQLFGHRKGSFTGALKNQQGIIERANGGTLFLDEIGELSESVQPKFLRFLQNGEIATIGSLARKVDVRVLAATNRDLEREVREGRFREDLYFRLNVFHITVPPLRERTDDIPDLAHFFFEEQCRRRERELAGITPEAMQCLLNYSWPGNVRELRGEIERIVQYAKSGQYVGVESLSAQLKNSAQAKRSTVISVNLEEPIKCAEYMNEVEREIITQTLCHTNYDLARAAQILGISLRNLKVKLREQGLTNSTDISSEYML